MASTAFDMKDAHHRGSITRSEKSLEDRTDRMNRAEQAIPYSSSENSLKPIYDDTHRKLKPRHIQLIGIGGYESNAAYRVHADLVDAILVGPLAQRFLYRLVNFFLFKNALK